MGKISGISCNLETSKKQFASFHDGEARQIGKRRSSRRRLCGRSKPTLYVSSCLFLGILFCFQMYGSRRTSRVASAH